MITTFPSDLFGNQEYEPCDLTHAVKCAQSEITRPGRAKTFQPNEWRRSRGGALKPRMLLQNDSSFDTNPDSLRRAEVHQSRGCLLARELAGPGGLARELEVCSASHAMRAVILANLYPEHIGYIGGTCSDMPCSLPSLLFWIRRREENMRSAYHALAALANLRRRNVIHRMVLPEQHKTHAIIKRLVRGTIRDSVRLARTA